MNWTKEVPKVDGWYWVWWTNELGRSGKELLLVEDGEPRIFGDDRWYPLSSWLYCGPIEVPQPPEAE